ncbi:MAG: hypothetical protein U1D97_12450 [Desulfuromonadales bacterium]|nr:hypothetical protein [Desulfuromonadales bacterium]
MKYRIVSAAIAIFILSGCSPVVAVVKKHEKDYQNAWCSEMNGKVEVRLDDGTRVDCLTDEYAVEVDFAKKWAESIGQSLYYADRTGRKPGVLLIVGEDDQRFLDRLETVAAKSKIKVWIVPSSAPAE